MIEYYYGNNHSFFRHEDAEELCYLMFENHEYKYDLIMLDFFKYNDLLVVSGCGNIYHHPELLHLLLDLKSNINNERIFFMYNDNDRHLFYDINIIDSDVSYYDIYHNRMNDPMSIYVDYLK